MAKIENIKDLKQTNVAPVAPEQETMTDFFTRLMKEENRVAVSQKIDEFVKESDFRFEEILLGLADYGVSVLVKNMVDAIGDNEAEVKALDERFLKARTEIANTLNKTEKLSMGESIVTMLSFVTESIGIIAEDAIEFEAKDKAGE